MDERTQWEVLRRYRIRGKRDLRRRLHGNLFDVSDGQYLLQVGELPMGPEITQCMLLVNSGQGRSRTGKIAMALMKGLVGKGYGATVRQQTEEAVGDVVG